MSRYIDIEPILEWCGDPEVCEPYGINSVELERKLYDTPSIDIVRCKECKWCDWGSDRVTRQTVYICQRKNDENLWEEIKADDFCSYGERKL